MSENSTLDCYPDYPGSPSYGNFDFDNTDYTDYDINVIHKLKLRAARTPDYFDLRLRKYIPIFVFNDLKKDFQHDHLMYSSEYLGRGCTLDSKYSLKEIVHHNNELEVSCFKINYNLANMITARVIGDIWACPPETVLDLDLYHGNNIRNIRQKINILCWDQSIPTKAKKKRQFLPFEAYAYIADDDFWDDYDGCHFTSCALKRFNNEPSYRYFEYFKI